MPTWIKAEWEEQVASMTNLIHSPGNTEILNRPRKTKRSWVWTPSDSGHIKVNVDGSFLGV